MRQLILIYLLLYYRVIGLFVTIDLIY